MSIFGIFRTNKLEFDAYGDIGFVYAMIGRIKKMLWQSIAMNQNCVICCIKR